MTWGGFLSRFLSVILVLPLVLTKFPAADIALWYLFVTFVGLQQLVSAGFNTTFSRVLSYTAGGADLSQIKSPKGESSGTENWPAAESVFATMGVVYVALAIVWVLIISGLGSFLMIKPVSVSSDPGSAWLAWMLIIVATAITVTGGRYSSYLHGMNQVARLERWNIITTAGSTVSSVIVLLNDGSVLSLVIANQLWTVLLVIRNRWLAKRHSGGRFRRFSRRALDRTVFNAVWPSAWRSAVGIFSGYGLLQLSGVLYAQLAQPIEIATYLLALRLIQAISQFSQAPFYSKLPLMARLYSMDSRTELLRVAERGMRLTYWTFCLGWIALGIVGDRLLDVIESNAAFPAPLLWTLLGLAYFVQRYGAMHIQLYSLTNIIIWHISNGVSGAIFILLSIILFSSMGVYAFPAALLIGYLCFHAWYPAVKSYETFNLSFMRFETRTVLPPLAIVIGYTIIQLIYNT